MAAEVGIRRSFALPGWVPRRTELVVPAVVGVLQYAASLGAEHHPHHSHLHLHTAGWVLLAVGPLALTMRRRHPVATMWVAFAATMGSFESRFAYLSLIVALLHAAMRGHRAATWSAIAAGYAWMWLGPALFGNSLPTLTSAILLASWLLVLGIAGEALRIRQERVAERAVVRRLDASQRVSEARLRVARDLHDVVGHNISLINVRAGVGLDLIDSNPAEARAALEAIKKVSKEALDELRTMLATLREQDEPAPRAPTPGLARLDDLVETTRAAGVGVTVTTEGAAVPLNATTDVAAYRIIQESLTNVARHAGGSGARVRLSYEAELLRVEVVDDGPGAGRDATSRGTGITGMTERAAAVGGELHAGSRPAGGFAVAATLPIEPGS